MYVLALLWDDFNSDVLMDLQCHSTMERAIAEGRKWVEECSGNHYQIYQHVSNSSKMELIIEGPEEE